MLAYLPIPVFLWWILRRAGWRGGMPTTTEMPVMPTTGPVPTEMPTTTILPELPTLPPNEEIPEMISEIIEEGGDKIPIDNEEVPVEKIIQMYEEETGKKAPRNLMGHEEGHTIAPPEYEYEVQLEQNQNVPNSNNSNFSLTQILNIIRQKNTRNLRTNYA